MKVLQSTVQIVHFINPRQIHVRKGYGSWLVCVRVHVYYSQATTYLIYKSGVSNVKIVEISLKHFVQWRHLLMTAAFHASRQAVDGQKKQQ